MTNTPNLLIPREEADRILSLHITKGNNLFKYELSTQGLNEAMEKLEIWDNETKSLLAEIFDSNDIVIQYSDVKPIFLKSGKDDFSLIHNHDTLLQDKVRWVEGLKKDLSLYKETIERSEPNEDFWNLIHPSISGLCKSRFDNEHYADSIETAFKYINNAVKSKVKKKTGNELDGASLMTTAFSPKTPIISLDDLSTESGRNIQQGYMQIFAGSMTGIRNPKAHDIIHIDRQRAIHFLFLASLLMNKLDEAI